MPTTTELIVLFILVLIITVVVLYILIGGTSNSVSFVTSRLGLAKDTLTTLANSALSEANSVIGQALDFATLAVSDINIVLQAAANAFSQLVGTIGQVIVDAIVFIATYFEASNTALTNEINGFFTGLLDPIFDTISNAITTISAIIVALFRTFNPTTC
jgi:predicted PurR-regulated permease PerM